MTDEQNAGREVHIDKMSNYTSLVGGFDVGADWSMRTFSKNSDSDSWGFICNKLEEQDYYMYTLLPSITLQ